MRAREGVNNLFKVIYLMINCRSRIQAQKFWLDWKKKCLPLETPSFQPYTLSSYFSKALHNCPGVGRAEQSGDQLSLYQWGTGAVWQSWPPHPTSKTSGIRSQAQGACHLQCTNTHCHLCYVQSSKPVWKEVISTHEEMRVPSGKEACLRSHGQLTPQLEF